jgi:hypothetical protein
MVLCHFQSFLKGIPTVIIGLTMACMMLYHFGIATNTKYVTEWKYDCNTQHMLKDVYADYKTTHHGEKIKMAIHWTFEPTINFYRVTQPYNWLDEVNREGFEHKADYYYIYQEDSAYLYKTGKIILKRYPFSNTMLAKDTVSCRP